MSLATDTPPVLGLELAGTRMTPGEFDTVEEWDEDYTYELIHGILVVTPVPLPQETGPNERLGQWLLNYRDQHPQGSRLDYTLMEQYVRTADSRRRADRLIWAGLGRLPRLTQDVPTIAVEFVSAGKRNRHRDYVEKRQEYLTLGVREYWIIDRFRRTLTVCRSGAEDRVIGEAEVYRPELLPGFELPVSPILAAADLWEGQS
jgi:Uma2 family endonuclease